MKIAKFDDCTGCLACVESCPVNIIKFEINENNGFIYPRIDDESKCLNCYKCSKTCPELNHIEFLNQKKNYFAQSKDINILTNSTSGGIASSLASTFINNGGIVYGAAFSSDMKVEHVRCDSLKDCNRIKGSKYVQSDLSKIYSQIKEDIQMDRSVLFIGTPCQCAAMKSLFKSNKLFCCDFICNGVGSPLIFKEHIKYLEKSYNCIIKDYVFRPKVENYLEPYERFIDTNNNLYKIKGPWKKWGSLYYQGLILREKCYKCSYSLTTRISDITLSDIPVDKMNSLLHSFPHNIKKYGASFMSVNSDKGQRLINLIDGHVTLIETDMKIQDCNKHLNQNIDDSKVFCENAIHSIEKEKIKYLGWKMKIKSFIIEFLK